MITRQFPGGGGETTRTHSSRGPGGQGSINFVGLFGFILRIGYELSPVTTRRGRDQTDQSNRKIKFAAMFVLYAGVNSKGVCESKHFSICPFFFFFFFSCWRVPTRYLFSKPTRCKRWRMSERRTLWVGIGMRKDVEVGMLGWQLKNGSDDLKQRFISVLW